MIGMKFKTRYILHELTVPFLLGLALFTGVFLMHGLYDLTESVISHGFSFPRMFLLVLSGLPETFFLTAPMAAILGVLMGYGRLAADNELVAFRVAGFSLISLIIPALVASLLLSGGLLALRQYGQPALGRARVNLLEQMAMPAPERLMAAESYLELGPYTIYAASVEGNQMGDVYLEDRSGPYPIDIYARQASWIRYSPELYLLRLEDGSMHQNPDEADYRVLSFQRQDVQIDLTEVVGRSISGGEETTSIVDLYRRKESSYKRYLEGKKQLAEAEKIVRLRENYREDLLEFHRALALPLAPFFLVLIAAPLGMLARQSGKAIGFILSLLLIFLYYLFSILIEPLAIQGLVPAGLALWVPNILFGLLGIVLIYRLQERG